MQIPDGAESYQEMKFKVSTLSVVNRHIITALNIDLSMLPLKKVEHIESQLLTFLQLHHLLHFP